MYLRSGKTYGEKVTFGPRSRSRASRCVRTRVSPRSSTRVCNAKVMSPLPVTSKHSMTLRSRS